MAGERTVQGSRWDGQDGRDPGADGKAYFPVLGNANLLFAPFQAAVGGFVGAYEISKHIVDFAGTIDKVSFRIKGNVHNAAATYTYQINGVDTDLTVTVPAGTDGEFSVPDGASASFVPGDEIVGIALVPGSRLLDPGLLQVYGEMTPDSGRHTVFRNAYGGSIYNGGVADPAVASYGLSGTSLHYNSDFTLNDDSDPLEVTQLPSALSVRAPGKYTYLQVSAAELDGDFEVYFDKNATPLPDDVDKALSVFCEDLGSPATVQRIDAEGEVNAVSGDLVSFTGVDRSGGGFNQLWTIGCNWEGTPANTLIDLMVGEAWQNSYDRENEFGFVQDSGLDGDWDYEWAASPLGTFDPSNRRLIDTDNRPLECEITPSFDMRLSHLRVYLDTVVHLDDRPGQFVIVRPLIEGGAGDLSVTCTEPGLYVDDASQDVVAAGRAWCFSLNGSFQRAVSQDPFIAHISWIAVSYGTENPSGGTEGPRIVPDPDPLTLEPCLLHRAKCWRITRTDGQVFAFTEHDKNISFAIDADSPETLTVFKACGGMEGGASELTGSVGETGSQEVVGHFTAAGISEVELLAGLFDNAEIEIWKIPWGVHAENEEAIQIQRGNLGVAKQGDIGFSVEALTLSAQLQRKSFMRLIVEHCDVKKLGDERCGVDLASLTVTGSATALAADDGYALTPKRTFTDATRTEDDGWFDEGTVRWLTGANANLVSQVKSQVGGTLVLWDPMLHAIVEGDTYELTPGCDRSFETCRDKFNNADNHRGFPDLPGNDAVNEFPKTKAN